MKVDRDVFEALGGTAAGKLVFDRLSAEMAPRNAQNLPDWMLGFQAFRSTLTGTTAKQALDEIARKDAFALTRAKIGRRK